MLFLLATATLAVAAIPSQTQAEPITQNNCTRPPYWILDGRDLMEEVYGHVTLLYLMQFDCRAGEPCKHQVHGIQSLAKMIRNHTDKYPAMKYIVIAAPQDRKPVVRYWKDRLGKLGIQVVQDSEANVVWNVLGGSAYDMFMYDTCGRQTFYVPYPQSNFRYHYAISVVHNTHKGRSCGPCPQYRLSRRLTQEFQPPTPDPTASFENRNEKVQVFFANFGAKIHRGRGSGRQSSIEVVSSRPRPTIKTGQKPGRILPTGTTGMRPETSEAWVTRGNSGDGTGAGAVESFTFRPTESWETSVSGGDKERESTWGPTSDGVTSKWIRWGATTDASTEGGGSDSGEEETIVGPTWIKPDESQIELDPTYESEEEGVIKAAGGNNAEGSDGRDSAEEGAIKQVIVGGNAQTPDDVTGYTTEPLVTTTTTYPFFRPGLDCTGFSDEKCYEASQNGETLHECCYKGVYMTDICRPGRCTSKHYQLCCFQKFQQSRYRCCSNASVGCDRPDQFSRCCYELFTTEPDPCCPKVVSRPHWAPQSRLVDYCLPNVELDWGSSKIKYQKDPNDDTDLHVIELSKVKEMKYNCNHTDKYPQCKHYLYIPTYDSEE